VHAYRHAGKVLGVLYLDGSLLSTIDPHAPRPYLERSRGFQTGKLE
jgi:prepilin-type processing-associated H-X9-DG protein